MKRTPPTPGNKPLRSKKRMKPRSDRRAERLEKIEARGPLQAEACRRPCKACGRPAPSTPAHLQRVGKGHGDWVLVNGVWLGRVGALCWGCHQAMDGNVWAPARVRRAILRAATVSAVAVGKAWALAVGVEVTAEEHPYKQWRALGSPQAGDNFEEVWE